MEIDSQASVRLGQSATCYLIFLKQQIWFRESSSPIDFEKMIRFGSHLRIWNFRFHNLALWKGINFNKWFQCWNLCGRCLQQILSSLYYTHRFRLGLCWRRRAINYISKMEKHIFSRTSLSNQRPTLHQRKIISLHPRLEGQPYVLVL